MKDKTARVKIAPIEQWCGKPSSNSHLLEGKFVTIIISRMTEGNSTYDDTGTMNCKGKTWPLERDSAIELRTMLGRDWFPHEVWICEHMLEMD